MDRKKEIQIKKYEAEINTAGSKIEELERLRNEYNTLINCLYENRQDTKSRLNQYSSRDSLLKVQTKFLDEMNEILSGIQFEQVVYELEEGKRTIERELRKNKLKIEELEKKILNLQV